jgi:tRNA(Ile)-lysidine synthase
VLRHWLRQEAGAAPTEAQLSELLDQIDACRTRGHRLQLRVAGGQVQRADDHLVYRTL